MGIAYLGIGTGGVIVPYLSAGLIKMTSWHTALVCLGILMIIISFPLAFFIKGKPVTDGSKKEEKMVPVSDILRNPDFYLLAFGSMCSIAAVGGANQHLKLYLTDLHYTQTGAATVISLVLFSSLAGRVIMGWLADIFPRKYVMILIYMIIASAIPLLLLPEFPGRVIIFALLFGLGLGGDYMIIPLMAGDLFGIRALGRVMGIILVADGMAEASGPMMVGAIYDHAGKSYTPGFIVLICIALAGAIIVSFLPGKKSAC
jgi:MFS family permease